MKYSCIRTLRLFFLIKTWRRFTCCFIMKCLSRKHIPRFFKKKNITTLGVFYFLFIHKSIVSHFFLPWLYKATQGIFLRSINRPKHFLIILSKSDSTYFSNRQTCVNVIHVHKKYTFVFPIENRPARKISIETHNCHINVIYRPGRVS